MVLGSSEQKTERMHLGWGPYTAFFLSLAGAASYSLLSSHEAKKSQKIASAKHLDNTAIIGLSEISRLSSHLPEPAEHHTSIPNNQKQTESETQSQIEGRAFSLSAKPSSRSEARKLFRRLFESDVTHTLAAQMFVELSQDQQEKEEAAEALLAIHTSCEDCNEIGLIAADLMLSLGRISDAKNRLNQLTREVKTESQRRHLAVLQQKTGNYEGARNNLDAAMSASKRSQIRSGILTAAAATWEKIDQEQLNLLTNRQGVKPGKH